MSDVTLLLQAVRRGDDAAAEKLFPLVYDELRQLAAAKMARERPGHTLQATALVHEAWLRLGGEVNVEWDSRGHFFSAAAEAMRRILVDHARRRLAARRGGAAEHVDIDGLEIAGGAAQTDDELLAVNEALDKLAAVAPERAELVKLRYFGGLTMPEAAATQGVSLATAERHWTFARAWLHRELKRQPPA